MNKAARVYVAGHTGLAGSAILRSLVKEGFSNIVCAEHRDLELTCQDQVRQFFDNQRPEYVFLCAAKVGGIVANRDAPASFIRENLEIQTNLISCAHEFGVKRLVFLGSSCVYPRDCPQPIKEEYLLSGPLEMTNRAYAVAKIAGIELCWSYNRQFKSRFVALMPTNLYGPGDNYDLETAHVLPALLSKMHLAVVNNETTVTVWGTGRSRREFLHSDDLASCAMHVMALPDSALDELLLSDIPPTINVGWGKDLSIRELVEMVKIVTGFEGKVCWDHSKPDGTPQKLLDIDKVLGLGWQPRIELKTGLKQIYNYHFLTNSDSTDSCS